MFSRKARVGARVHLPSSAQSALFFILIAVVYVVRIATVWRFTTDDAGITYAYALHAAQGDGLRAVLGGPTVEGYSNFLWLLILLGVSKLGASIFVAGKLLGALFGAAGIGLAIVLLRRLEARDGPLDVADLVLGLLLSLCAEYTIWSVGGLENSLFACLLLLLVIRCAYEHDASKSWPLSSLFAFLLTLTRPEGPLYVIALFAVWGAIALRRRLGGWRFFVAGTLFAIPFLLYHAWHYAQFHDLRPNTFYAKHPALDRSHLRDGWAYLFTNLQTAMFGFGGPLALVACFRDAGRRLFLPSVLVAGIAFIFYAGGDWMGHFRLGSHLIPIYVVLVVAGGRIVANHPFFRREVSGRRSRLALYAALLCLLGIWLYRHESNARYRAQLDRPTGSHFERVLNTADATYEKAARLGILPATILTHDFGGFAWRSKPEFQPIDYLGLCDPLVARVLAAWGDDRPHMQRAFLQSIFREHGPHPSLIFLPLGSFFAKLERSLDQELAYYRHPVQPSAMLLIHRGSLVHFHPPFSRLQFRALSDGTKQHVRLLGSSLRGALAPGQVVRLRLALLPLPQLESAKTATVRLALIASDQRVESHDRHLWNGDPELLRQWLPGEPLYFDQPLVVPDAPSTSYSFEIGLRFDNGPWHWHPLDTVAAGTQFVDPEVALPRYPSGLPGPTSPKLAALEARLQDLWQRRRLERDLTVIDRSLAAQLVEEGRAHDARHEDEDAYLAYVFATQAEPDRISTLVRRIHALRSSVPDGEDAFRRELELLRAFYMTGADEDARRLVKHLRDRRRFAEADYFAGKLHK